MGDLGPSREHAALSQRELATLEQLERALRDDGRGTASLRVRSWLRDAGCVCSHLARRAWVLAVVAAIALPFAAAVSSLAGELCALVLTGALVTWGITWRSERTTQRNDRIGGAS